MAGSQSDDPFETWCQRRGPNEPRANLTELYELVAEASGRTADQLTTEERGQIWERALPVIYPGYETIPNSERAERDPVELVPYDDGWPARFEAWKASLLAAMEPALRRIDHVGSTAIPRLSAKPVIDIQVSVNDLLDEFGYVPAIEQLGVQLRSRDDQHRFFRPFTGRPRDVQIHVCRTGSDWERRHLLFRDFLRADPAAREAYSRAKEAAAARWSYDRIAYAEAKTPAVAQVLAAAETWAGLTGWAVDRPARPA